MSRLTSKQRKALPAGDFAGPGRSFPMNDQAHVEAAVREEKFAPPATKAKINARAKAAGVDGGDLFMPHHKATKV